MVQSDLKKIIDEIAKTAEERADIAALLSELSALPKTKIPGFNSSRVRNQILDRIALPVKIVEEASFFGQVSTFAPYFRMGAGIMATLLIVVSLTLGTAVAALGSAPGSTIYPLKKIVENIQLRLTPNDQKTNLQLKFADNRVDELQQVLDNKQSGKISDQEAQAIIASAVTEIQKTTAAAVSITSPIKSTKNLVNKLTDISNKLKAASIQSEGQVKIELEKAIAANQITREEAIKNLEKAGLKVENSPILIDDSVTASGKLTAVTENDVSIGTAKFLLSADTKFINMAAKDLKPGQVVDIIGQIKDNKSYALKITKVTETKTETPAPDTTPATP